MTKPSKSLGNIVSLALSTDKAWNTLCVCLSVCPHRHSPQITDTHRRCICSLPLYLRALVLNSLAVLFDEFLEQFCAERIGWVTFNPMNSFGGARLPSSAFPVRVWWEGIYNYTSQKLQSWCAAVKRTGKSSVEPRCCQLRSCSITCLPLSA